MIARGTPLDTYTVGQVGRVSAALLSLVAAAIHFVVTGDHFDEWWGYGLFFAAIASYQAAWAVVVVAHPGRAVYLAGAAVNALAVLMWAMSRVVGTPLGPAAGEVEAVTLADAVATGAEICIVLICAALLLTRGEIAFLRPRQYWGTLASVVLVAMPLTVSAVVQWPPEGGHHRADGEAAAGHHPDAETADSPTLAALKVILREQGTGAAITRLEELAAADRTVLAEAHQFVHSLGKYSFIVYGSAPKAFGQCRETFESGCYHGVLQAYFDSKAKVTPQEVASLCDQAVGAGGSMNQRFQCVHGLGHGLTSNLEYKLFDALKYCDALGSEWDQRSCYGGVFMENVMFARTQYFGITDAQSGQHEDHRANLKAFVSADDPLFPCSAVADKYRDECYVMQTAIILMDNKFDYPKAFQTCDSAPAKNIAMCYEGMGREITGQTLKDNAQSLRLCMLGNPSYRASCMVGVAKNFVNLDLRTEKAFAFCSKVPSEAKTPCYTAIGEQVITIHQDLSAQAAECAKAEAAYREACAAGAQLTRRS